MAKNHSPDMHRVPTPSMYTATDDSDFAGDDEGSVDIKHHKSSSHHKRHHQKHHGRASLSATASSPQLIPQEQGHLLDSRLTPVRPIS